MPVPSPACAGASPRRTSVADLADYFERRRGRGPERLGRPLQRGAHRRGATRWPAPPTGAAALGDVPLGPRARSGPKDPSVGARMINARAETLLDKPAFRRAFERQRCIVPADGFYEWQTVEGREAEAALVHRAAPTASSLAFAGLWESWRPPRGATSGASVAARSSPRERQRRRGARSTTACRWCCRPRRGTRGSTPPTTTSARSRPPRAGAGELLTLSPVGTAVGNVPQRRPATTPSTRRSVARDERGGAPAVLGWSRGTDRILTVRTSSRSSGCCCIPVFLWLLFGRGQPGRRPPACSPCLGATDWVDGYIARHFDQVSTLGKILDPTADRLLLARRRRRHHRSTARVPAGRRRPHARPGGARRRRRARRSPPWAPAASTSRGPARPARSA